MSILIQNATILPMGSPGGFEATKGDLLIEGDIIAAIGRGIRPGTDARVIDGTDKLVMPGLYNAHLHSNEALFKGRYDNMPLEIWMLYAYPILAGPIVPKRLLYLRSMLVAIESLRNGVTALTDDISDRSQDTLDQLDAVVDAYDEIGIRATVSSNVIDRNFLDTIPFTREIVPRELWEQAEALPQPSVGAYVDFMKSMYQRFHNRSGRIRVMVAPSAPQRCTPELMQACNELAVAWRVPLHTHIVETKVQGVTGPEFYGKTLIGYMKELGLLHRGTTIAHSIWVTDDDIALMGEAGCSIAHNVISNQKLGAGVAPMRKLLDAGVNVALGSDGVSTSDSARMFDVMHACGLIHKVMTPDYRRWVTATEVLNAGTLAGARSAMIEHETGSLEVGKKADLIILDMNSVAFSPLNDVRNHLVYSENGSSVETVIVNGEVVLEAGKLTKIDEKAILAEFRAMMPEYLAIHAKAEAANKVLEPYFAQIHKRANTMDIGINRLGNEVAWTGW